MSLRNLSAGTPEELKSCCAAAYESPWAQLLLGDSFHPGGVELTLYLGEKLELGPGRKLLDVACGRGTSAVALAKQFGCSVSGVDLGEESIEAANALAVSEGVEGLVSFEVGDAERLSADDASFDALICECAFCTFPSKSVAASEFLRVVRPGGSVGISDITRKGQLPPELETLLGWIACLADARPIEEYSSILADAGLLEITAERHDETIEDLAKSVKFKLLGVEVLARVGKGPVPLEEVLEAKRVTKAAAASAKEGILGYALLVGKRAE